MPRLKNLRRVVVFCFLSLFLFVAAGAHDVRAKNRWKLATLAPREIGWSQQVRKHVLPWLEGSTENSIQFKFYWGGVMGNDEEYIKKIRIGQLQGAGVSGLGTLLACPEANILALPFLFNGYDEVDHVRDTMFEDFDEYFKKNGFKLVLWVDQGFDQCYSSRYKMDTLEDFHKARFQNWYGPMEAAVLQSLGNNPIPMEVMEGHSAFKTGMIDAAFGPALYYVASQLYVVFKYVNPMKLRYSPGVIMVDVKVWDKLPAEYQRKMEAGRPAVTAEFVKAVRKDNARSYEAIVSYGVKEEPMTPAVLAEVKKRTRPVWDEFAGRFYPRSFLNKLENNLKDYRRQKAQPKTVAAEKPAARHQPVPAAKPTASAPPEAPLPEAAATPSKVPAVKIDRPAPAPPRAAPVEKAPVEPAPAVGQKTAAPQVSRVDAPEPTKHKALTREEKKVLVIKKVQEKLKEQGYYRYGIDGIFGPGTYKGILQYQKDHDLSQTGFIDTLLLKSMGIDW